MHPSMGMGTDAMMMNNGMGMMQHGMMVGGGAPAMGMMGRPGMMVDRSMMDDGMGMMGSH
jgi:hypothetical protein